MSRNTNFLSYFFMQLEYNWEWLKYKIYSYLLKQSPVITSKKYLQTHQQDIRVFIPGGTGYGDQIFPLDVIRNLRNLKFSGIIEIIAHTDAFAKIKTLLSIAEEHSPNSTFTLPNYGRLRLMDFNYFKNQNVSKVELAYFPVYPLEHLRKLIQVSHSDYDTFSLPEIAHAERVIVLNPFLGIAKVGNVNWNMAIQLKDQPFKVSALRILQVKPVIPNIHSYRNALKQLENKQPALASMINTVISKKNSGTINTLSIYGLGAQSQPEVAMLNVFLSTTLVNQDIGKPLVILVMCSISNTSWEAIQQFFKSQKPQTLVSSLQRLKSPVHFLDYSSNHTFQLPHLNNSSAIILRLPPLPSTIFNYVYLQSSYPPLYEGANLARLLYESRTYGLYCQRAIEPFSPDMHDLPLEISSITNAICPVNGGQDWFQKPTPVDKLIPVIKQFANATRLEPLETDAVSFATQWAIESPNCEQAPAKCAFFKSSHHPNRVFAIHAETTINTALLASTERITRWGLKKIGFKQKNAHLFSNFLRFGLSYFSQDQENRSAIIYVGLALVSAFVSSADLEDKKILPISPNALIQSLLFLFQLLPYISGETDNLFLITTLLLNVALTQIGVDTIADIFDPPTPLPSPPNEEDNELKIK